MNFGHIKNIHFVGIGGIGMSGIAEILTNYDLAISGCDLKASSTTERLERSGVHVAFPQDPSHVDSADLVVISSAIKPANPEVVRARERRIPVIRRAEMLGEITRLMNGICIAGTHGKTTTSAMTAMVLAEAGLDPTLIIGGVLRNLDTNAQLGRTKYLVVEADEYDRSFLDLYPSVAVITNIEADHLDCYVDLDDIRNAFAQFVRRVPFYGLVVGCVDDANTGALVDGLSKRVIRCGIGEAAELRATDLRFSGTGSSFEVSFRGRRLGSVELHVPGEHNVRNALAAIAVAEDLEIPFEKTAAGLAKFRGVERRFQILGEYRGAVVVDDYAHHPTEIRATLEAARRSYPDRRLVALFQPHLFTRTRDFYADFAASLALADVAFVAPIYPAREEPIEGVTSALITDTAEKRGSSNVRMLDRSNREIAEELGMMLDGGDLFITMGAGDVHTVGEMLIGGGR
jgi:UDP-N-acetylmuramate--alanine ligase